MSFGEAVRSVFGNYAKFDGRATRSEYWWFQLFNLLVILAFYAVVLAFYATTRTFSPVVAVFGVALIVYFVIAIIPSLAVTVRRLHDTDKSGWWLLIGLIPYLGALILFIFTVLPSTPGLNRYGPPYGMSGSIRRAQYRGATPSDAWARYTDDARNAGAAGYEPVSQQWRRDGLGDYLEVTYAPTFQQHWQPSATSWNNASWTPGQGPTPNQPIHHPFNGPPPDGSGGSAQ